MNELEVGTHIDLRHLNERQVTARPKADKPGFSLVARALDASGTRFSFKPSRSIPVVFA
jgi:hypothetical protein